MAFQDLLLSFRNLVETSKPQCPHRRLPIDAQVITYRLDAELGYVCDCWAMMESGMADVTKTILNVEINKFAAGAGVGIYYLPETGAKVKINYVAGDESRPYLDFARMFLDTVPAISPGVFRIQRTAVDYIDIAPAAMQLVSGGVGTFAALGNLNLTSTKANVTIQSSAGLVNLLASTVMNVVSFGVLNIISSTLTILANIVSTGTWNHTGITNIIGDVTITGNLDVNGGQIKNNGTVVT